MRGHRPTWKMKFFPWLKQFRRVLPSNFPLIKSESKRKSGVLLSTVDTGGRCPLPTSWTFPPKVFDQNIENWVVVPPFQFYFYFDLPLKSSLESYSILTVSGVGPRSPSQRTGSKVRIPLPEGICYVCWSIHRDPRRSSTVTRPTTVWTFEISHIINTTVTSILTRYDPHQT